MCAEISTLFIFKLQGRSISRHWHYSPMRYHGKWRNVLASALMKSSTQSLSPLPQKSLHLSWWWCQNSFLPLCLTKCAWSNAFAMVVPELPVASNCILGVYCVDIDGHTSSPIPTSSKGSIVPIVMEMLTILGLIFSSSPLAIRECFHIVTNPPIHGLDSQHLQPKTCSSCLTNLWFTINLQGSELFTLLLGVFPK